MAFMAAALPYISAGASIGASIGQGNAQAQVQRIKAKQLKKQAIADEANAVQVARNQTRTSTPYA